MSEQLLATIFRSMAKYDTLESLQACLQRARENDASVSSLEMVGVTKRDIEAFEKKPYRITSLDQLLAMSREEMLAIPNVGDKTVERVMRAVSCYEMVERNLAAQEAELRQSIAEYGRPRRPTTQREKEKEQQRKADNHERNEEGADLREWEDSIPGWDSFVPSSEEPCGLVCPTGAGDSFGDESELRRSA